MKLPVSKEEDGKRMMMTSGTSTGRKGLICERREGSVVGGHDTQEIQFRANMDLGSGDTPDHYALGTDVLNSYEPLKWDPHFELATTKTHASATALAPSPPPSPPPSKPPPIESISYSSENVHENAVRQLMRLDSDNSLEEKQGRSANARNASLAVVEDGKEANFRANESNPTVPAASEPSKSSTLRLSDRTRSGRCDKHKVEVKRNGVESEDDIEKMDEPEQEGTLIGHEALYKTQTTIDNSPNSDKIDKNGNRSDSDQNETDNDCVVQCLYYTIQCCECVIF